MTLPRDDTPVLLHNPRCSKSRKLRELLEERGVAFQERLYLDQPLSRDELDDLAERLGRPAAEWVRKGEAAFGERGLGAGSSEAELLDAVAAEPILLERPILLRGERARVGRPPEDALELVG